jgi:GDPmannose 4,6-dehydratase
LYAFWITKNYREAYGMYACNGILFNHESPMRGETFVTRKITRAAARISIGLQDKLFLGNLDAQRDWGHARDYVEGLWLMLQQQEADDFVLATGKTVPVKYFAELAFKTVGIDLVWEGSGVNERGIDTATGKSLVEVDPRYFRPTEVDLLLGDPSKAKEKLGWASKVTVEELAREMALADLELFKRDKYLLDGGHKVFNYHE